MYTFFTGLASAYPQPDNLKEFIVSQLYNADYQDSLPIKWAWKPEGKFNIRPVSPVTKNV